MPPNKIYITPPAGLKLVWTGIFDMAEVYRRMKYWMDFNGYGTDFEEKEYIEIVKGDSKDLNIFWYGEKAKTGYFAYVIEIKFLILGLKKAEIQKDDRKIKLNNGYFEIRTTGYILSNYKNNFKSKSIQDIYEKFIVKKRIDEHKIQFYQKLYTFQDEIRSFLAMY
ncbi:hypothetical protein CL621_03115 [archaeon]|nr:hypothetical protein [archaeon]|tara:strand:+ start:612 stop:1109 length:498 start_codon:yes stop_codon:yes gene_type:complete